MGLFSLMTMDEWAKHPENKGAIGKSCMKSRLEEKTEKRKSDAKAEEQWRKAVRKRDGMKCRWCRRHVVVTLEMLPERAECHHITPREHRPTRWDVRNGLLVCLACHQRLTGTVGGELARVVAGEMFSIDGHEYPSGSGPVNFKVL